MATRLGVAFSTAQPLAHEAMSCTNVPRDKLMAAIANVETLCEWLEEKMFDVKYLARRENAQSIAESAQGIKPTTGSAPT